MRRLLFGAASIGAASLCLLNGCSSGPSSSPTTPRGALGRSEARASGSYGLVSWQNGIPSVVPANVAERIFRADFTAGHPSQKGTTLPAYVYTCAFAANVGYKVNGDGCEVWSGSAYSATGLRATRYPATNNPQGAAVTTDGTFLIADTSNSSVDSMIHARSGNPNHLQTCVSEPGQWPVDVAATQGAKLIAIANIFTTSTGSGSLAVAAGCGSTPVELPNYNDHFIQGIGVAINRAGDCFFSYNDLLIGQGYVAKYTGCQGRGLKLPQYGLYGGNGMYFAGGIAFDKQDDMYLNDQTEGIWRCSASSGYDSCAQTVYTGINGVEDNIFLTFSQGWDYLLWSDADGNEICFTPTPVTNTQTCVKNTLTTAPYGIAVYKPSKL